VFGLVATTLCAQESARDPDSFEVEPPLLIPNRDKEPLPEVRPASASVGNVDLAKLEKQLERARRNAAGAERFYKIGAISKVEAEQRRLRATQLKFDLANARLVRAKEEMLSKQKQFESGEIEKANLVETQNALALAIEAAHAAAAERQQVNLEAAEANVHRQEKLVALGSARKSDVERAEIKLAELKAQTN